MSAMEHFINNENWMHFANWQLGWHVTAPTLLLLCTDLEGIYTFHLICLYSSSKFRFFKIVVDKTFTNDTHTKQSACINKNSFVYSFHSTTIWCKLCFCQLYLEISFLVTVLCDLCFYLFSFVFFFLVLFTICSSMTSKALCTRKLLATWTSDSPACLPLSVFSRLSRSECG